MINRLELALTFFIVLFIVYLISSLGYSRELSDIAEVLLYYGMFALTVFLVDGIRQKWMKWVLLMLVVCILTLIFILGAFAPDISSLYFLQVMAPVNVPFLPDMHYYNEMLFVKMLMILFLYFYLPIIYFCVIIFILKRIFKRWTDDR